MNTVNEKVVWSAILFADMVGFSGLMERDELSTLEFLASCGKLVKDLAGHYDGKLAQTTGDGFLLLFDRPRNAMDFGLELHSLISKRQKNNPEPVLFRVGIHCGNVFSVGGDIAGNAVNIAARLEGQASPGTCVISQNILDRLNRKEYQLRELGTPKLKNISEQICLYQTISRDTISVAQTAGKAKFLLLRGVVMKSESSELSFADHKVLGGILCYLSLSDSHFAEDSKLAGLFWPDETPTVAKALLECQLTKLDQLLSSNFPDLLVRASGTTGLNELLFSTDIDKLKYGAANAKVESQVLEMEDWSGRIAEGFEEISTVFATWLLIKRASLRENHIAFLLVSLARVEPYSTHCLTLATALLLLEPGNERASLALMRYLAARGSRDEALSEYDRLAQYLADKHNQKPSESAEDFHSLIREDRLFEHEAADLTRSLPPLLRINVKQFEDGQLELSHLVSGFRTALISNLTRFREWSVAQVNDQKGLENSKEGEGGFDYVITGTFLPNETFRLVVSNVKNKNTVWRVDTRLDINDWSTTHRKIVGRIAAHLQTYISTDRLLRVIPSDTELPMNHDTWLQAERAFSSWTPTAAAKAENLLRDLIVEAPSFSPAYSSLASFHNVHHIIRPGVERDPTKTIEAHQFAKRSVELDPMDARNHLAVAWSAGMSDNFDGMAIHLDMAESLNPNDPGTLISCAMGQAFAGQSERGELLVKHVKLITPQLDEHQWCYVASVHFLSGRYDEALRAARMSGDRIVDNQGWIAASLVKLGKNAEARTAFEYLIDAVRPVWSGRHAPTAETVYDWFVSAYPIRNRSDVLNLSESLFEALSGQ